MSLKRSHSLAITAWVAGVVVVVWMGLPRRGVQPLRTALDREVASGSAVRSPAASDERALRLQGRAEALESREADRAGTASPGAGALPPADPSPPGGEPAPQTSDTPEPIRMGPLPSAGVSLSGDVVFGQATWTTAAVPEGYPLVCYLIGALAPTPPDLLLPALRGLPDDAPEADAGPDPWWARLAEALVEAVGRDRWPLLDTLLTWDSEHAALYVQQDAEGHSRVTDLLKRRAAGYLSRIQVVLELEPSTAEPADLLRVDVPWGRTVRAHHGSVWAFLGAPIGTDFDVEIASEPLIALSTPPLVAGLDTGTAVSARRVEAEDGSAAIEVEVAASRGQPRFEPVEVTPFFTSVPVTIEVPRLAVARWRGRVPARPGKHHVQLDDGRSATLLVLASQPGSTPDPAFVRHVVAPRLASPSPSSTHAAQSIVVTWLAPGPLQGRALAIPLRGQRDYRDGSPAQGSCTVASQGQAVDPDRECPWPLAEGGVRIQVAVVTAGDMDIVDMIVERCDPASDERQSAPFLDDDWIHDEVRPRYETLSLPVCRVRVDTRRLYLPVGEETSVHLDGDAGATVRVALPRAE